MFRKKENQADAAVCGNRGPGESELWRGSVEFGGTHDQEMTVLSVFMANSKSMVFVLGRGINLLLQNFAKELKSRQRMRNRRRRTQW